jgi:thioester reductase-like protein/acyl-coenzyme A synthetase/AMP-(fatty) acid ligase
MDTTYFTCTLGQAVHHQSGKSYKTINDFIEHKARSVPHGPAVGFYEVSENASQSWKSHVFTFEGVHRGIVIVADRLSKVLAADKGQTVALLCPSSAEFLFTWLALIWLGHPVLLVAPQCSASAVAQLCKACGVTYLIYDEGYKDLASDVSKLGGGYLNALLLPFAGENIFEVTKCVSARVSTPPATVQETDIAYLHHTSGTSTGMPKPIPQSHRAAVGMLPTLNGRSKASFTTTPLYHGGVADLFRAWSSEALIWLFPGKELPITAANVCKCLDIAAATTSARESSAGVSEVKYFSSVPYVLQMMAEDKDGLKHLQQMDIVGVGGAALPAEVGDKLVQNKVNLISRFGSAECGFLMSSHREYATDKQWEYLRSSSSPAAEDDHLRFEPREDGLSELVIQPGWPHMAKRNRDDGSYATADLFAPHPSIPYAWRYHSRADSQLTLITGKKFDPAPLEDSLRASASAVVEDVLIFGTGKPYPGALLFRSRDPAAFMSMNTTDEEFIDEVAPLVEKLNRHSQSHAQISRSMLVPMPRLEHGLEKSSKGTLLRRKAEERFSKEINAAYENVSPEGQPSYSTDVPDADVSTTIRDIVMKVAGEARNREDNNAVELADQTDLFSYGIDSVAALQIRQALLGLIPRTSTLPLTIVQDAGTISRLADLVLRLRSGRQANCLKIREQDEREQTCLMLDLAKEYSVFNDPHPRLVSSTCSSPGPLQSLQSSIGTQVLLTGPTGSLGAHILSQLVSSERISRIHLLVRGASPSLRRERVLNALSPRCLTVPRDFDTKVQIYNCKLSDPRLGLSQVEYMALSESVDVIVHLAWSVNFLQPLRSFAPTHLAGLKNLIDFALSSPPRPAKKGHNRPPRMIFCSSVAAVSNYGGVVPERALVDDRDTSVAGPTGYARSKWVAERMCWHAHATTRLRGRISIARVGQLSGAQDTGVWSASEAYPLMLASAKATGVLPDLDSAKKARGFQAGEVLAWLPVDIAAQAFVEDIVGDVEDGLQQEEEEEEGEERKTANQSNHSTNSAPTADKTAEATEPGIMLVHHVLNPSWAITWSHHLLRWLSRQEASFQTVSVDAWLSRLETLHESRDAWKRNHPSLKLLPFWKGVYGLDVTDASSVRHEMRNGNGNRPDSREEVEMTNRRGTVPATQEAATATAAATATGYEMSGTYERMPCLRECEGAVTEEYVVKLWRWVKENV